MNGIRTYKIWLLALVPDRRFGRWIAAASIVVIGIALFWLVVHASFRDAAAGARFRGWPVAVFFVAAVAYIVPVFHYITARTKQAMETLMPYVTDTEDNSLADSIDRRALGWTLRTGLVAFALWLGQSYLLAGDWVSMWAVLTGSGLDFLMAVSPLVVWLTMTASMSALFHNAVTFRRLSARLNVDIFEPDSYMPIGSMAVTSTLVVVGALALLSIMWIDGPVNWWTTLPAMAFFSPLVVALLLIPVLPVHRRLVSLKVDATRGAQTAVRQASTLDGSDAVAARAAALSYRREVARLSTWPFDVPAITRVVAYAIIVPLTWAGAALIEILVNAILS